MRKYTSLLRFLLHKRLLTLIISAAFVVVALIGTAMVRL